MADNLDTTLEDLISSIEETTRREYSFVKNDDWTTVDKNELRKGRHDLHFNLTNKAVLNSKKVFSVAGTDLKHPRIKKLMKTLLGFFELYSSRGNKYLLEKDWTKFLENGEGNEGDANFEIEFQNNISNNIFKFKTDLKGINDGEEITTVAVSTFNDTPIPLAMKDVIFERYPEVKELVDKKLSTLKKKKNVK